MHNYNDQLEKIENKVDGLHEKISDINVILVRQEENIAHHIKRSDMLEEMVLPLRDKMQQLIGVGKFLGLIAVLGSVYEVLKTIFK